MTIFYLQLKRKTINRIIKEKGLGFKSRSFENKEPKLFIESQRHTENITFFTGYLVQFYYRSTIVLLLIFH